MRTDRDVEEMSEGEKRKHERDVLDDRLTEGS